MYNVLLPPLGMEKLRKYFVFDRCICSHKGWMFSAFTINGLECVACSLSCCKRFCTVLIKRKCPVVERWCCKGKMLSACNHKRIDNHHWVRNRSHKSHIMLERWVSHHGTDCRCHNENISHLIVKSAFAKDKYAMIEENHHCWCRWVHKSCSLML